jgi:ATP-dependent exoDNAse (exonuclease V) alpha subunit
VISGSRVLPASHISIRVPWHDTDWGGRVCRRPVGNTSCLVLRRIGASRDDAKEEALAGKSFGELVAADRPPCVAENVSFMSPVEVVQEKSHPYAEFSEVHKHFAPTNLRQPPFSAACIPFRWMLREQAFGNAKKKVVGFAEQLRLSATPEREPELGEKLNSTAWIQERENQLVMLDTFFSAVVPQTTLCFFYAKRTPLSEDPRRVIIGVARCTHIGEAVEYRYNSPSPALRGMLWERMVTHSLRPDSNDGFLLPYHELLEKADSNPEIIPSEYAAFAPDQAWDAYSFATEHVSSDQAIESLLACHAALDKLSSVVETDVRPAKRWIDQELNRLWQLRGAFPGFGSALCAFGLVHGTLIAHAMSLGIADPLSDNPWERFDEVVRNPSLLPPDIAADVGLAYRRVWEQLKPERKALLQLLSRYAITADQAITFFQPTEREKAGIYVSDGELLENPYLLFEQSRNSADPISVTVVDRGAFPEAAISLKHPIPAPSAMEDAVDPRRVRALVIETLESAALVGHTLLPSNDVIQQVRDRELRPQCPLGPDVLQASMQTLAKVVLETALGDGRPALQLVTRSRASELIKKEIQKRTDGRRHQGEHPWRELVNGLLDTTVANPSNANAQDRETEERAREEKAAALEELYRGRISLLLGPAGSGKTTLLRVLCSLPEIQKGGVLLLAPTGKARVRLEQGTKLKGGLTLAQLLSRLGRYEGVTGRYLITGSSQKEGGYKTVIVDESSMLTEDQLASLIDALTGVERLILVGDTRQLPPIGAGRPFVDAAARLAPEGFGQMFPRVAKSIASLTISRRQEGVDRDDVVFARTFTDDIADVTTDDAWTDVLAGKSPFMHIVPWSTDDDLKTKFLAALTQELSLSSMDDEAKFAESLGGTVNNGWTYFNAAYNGRPGAAEKAEAWQILSPIRAKDHGVDALNRMIQKRFRARTLDSATPEKEWQRKIPKPKGPQQITYGDKVINVANELHFDVFPRGDPVFVANGDIGIVVGQFKTPRFSGLPWKLEIEFTTGPGIKCGFGDKYFTEEGQSPLELAYALTVHKTQGSQFGTTFVVIPNPCWLLTRELLYTALTRHRERIVLFVQGDPRDLRKFASPAYSEVAARLTNLFRPANPVKVPVGNRERFLEEYLIHRTERGDLVRSKSEVIIADKLHSRRVNYGYEALLRLDSGNDVYPDFTIVDDASGNRFYWEHLGLITDPGYRRRWERKLTRYRGSGILPLEEGGGPNGVLIVTEDEPNGGIDSSVIAALVDRIAG